MSKKIKILIIILSAVVLLGVILGLSIYSVNSFHKNELIASNVTFNDVYIGDLEKEEALNLIQGKEHPVNLPIKVKYNDKVFEFAPYASGINYNFDSVIDYAYSYGRSGNFFKDLFSIIKSRFSYHPVPISYTYDEKAFENTINMLLIANDIDLKNVELNVYENYAQVKINDNLSGVDFTKLYADTMKIIELKDKRELELPVIKIDKVTAKMVYDLIYVEPKNASYKVVNGVTTVESHTIGVIVNIVDIENQMNQGKKSFTVPITKKYPEVRVENLGGELFPDVLGSYTSKYNAGIIGRTRNVTLAANKINGVILNSGDVFSYNNVVGPRSTKTGFSVATVYTKDGLSEEMGGGICQVSSTLYNAVLYADLQVVERKNHMYTVSYVKNGLDATVAYGLIDFKFKNNLKSPIKIVTSVGGGVLTVTLLGKKENNNKVELYTNTIASYPFSEKEVENLELQPGERKITQNGGNGYKINATKVVKDANGNIIRQDFLGTNVYKPLDQIVEVGPKVEEEVGSEEIVDPIPPLDTNEEATDEEENNNDEASTEDENKEELPEQTQENIIEEQEEIDEKQEEIE